MLVELETREQALLGFMAYRGPVTAEDAARALGIPVAQADEWLTALAKTQPERVTLDIDDEGRMHYRITDLRGQNRVRVEQALGSDRVGLRTKAGEAGEPREAREAEQVDEGSSSVEVEAHRRG
jgi:hypothetical protein